MALATPRPCTDRQLLFSRGDSPDGLYCVVEGSVRIGGIAEDGREALLALVEPPQWFGEISLLDGRPRTHDAWCQGETLLAHVPQAPLLALLEGQPGLWRALGQLVATKLRSVFVAMEQNALLAPQPRVAARLLSIAEGFGELAGQRRRTARVSQEQPALMLSLSRQTVNQALRALADAGCVRTVRGGVEILDFAALRTAAGLAPPG